MLPLSTRVWADKGRGGREAVPPLGVPGWAPGSRISPLTRALGIRGASHESGPGGRGQEVGTLREHPTLCARQQELALPAGRWVHRLPDSSPVAVWGGPGGPIG